MSYVHRSFSGSPLVLCELSPYSDTTAIKEVTRLRADKALRKHKPSLGVMRDGNS